jgi:hypothetical protein
MTDPLAYAVLYFRRRDNVMEDRIELFPTAEAAEAYRKRINGKKKNVIALIPEATARVLMDKIERLEMELRFERGRKQ